MDLGTTAVFNHSVRGRSTRASSQRSSEAEARTASKGGYREDELDRFVFDYVDRRRDSAGERVDSLAELFAAARAAGVRVSWRELSAFARTRGRGDLREMPECVSTFASAYLESDTLLTAYDPWVGLGSAALLAQGVEEGRFKTAVGIVPNADEHAVLQAAVTDSRIRWVHGSPGLAPGEDLDVLVTNPPFGLPNAAHQYLTATGTVAVNDSGSNSIPVVATRQLGPRGQFIALLPGRFLLGVAGSARYALPQFGFHLKAVLALPQGAFANAPGLEAYLVIADREEHDELFVGQLKLDGDNAELLANLRRWVPAELPALGRIVAPESFKSWRALLNEEEVRTHSAGGVVVRLGSAALDIRRGRPEFLDAANSVFIPMRGTARVVRSSSELSEKAQSYYQVVLDPKQAIADYVAGYLNTEVGKRTRAASQTGSTIPNLSRPGLEGLALILPPLSRQRDMSATFRTLEALMLRVGGLERDLWNQPEDFDRVAGQTREITESGSSDWIERLPFPLASVLWQHETTLDLRMKKEHLLDFFEALAKFIVALFIGAFQGDRSLFDSEVAASIRRARLERPTAGSWVTLLEKMAKLCTAMLQDGREPQVMTLFRTRRKNLLDAITSEELAELLRTATELRNRWLGHGGLETDDELVEVIDALEDLLLRFRKTFAAAFEDGALIAPGASEFAQGVHTYKVQVLVGRGPTFRETQMRFTALLEKGRLYWADRDETVALELAPFFRLGRAPAGAQAACYFFSELVDGVPNWVTYHLAETSHIRAEDQSLQRLIAGTPEST